VSFDVVIPYNASTAAAIEAIDQALQAQQSILSDPPPHALVEALEPDGIHLRVYYWIASKGVNQFQVMSDAKLQAKVALQKAGILSPQPSASAPQPSPATPATPVAAAPANGSSASANSQAHANLRQDSHAAAAAAAKPATPQDGRATPMEHVLDQAQSCVSDEGDNLLKHTE
jgi:small-conductance mechanosensitive channel